MLTSSRRSYRPLARLGVNEVGFVDTAARAIEASQRGGTAGNADLDRVLHEVGPGRRSALARCGRARLLGFESQTIEQLAIGFGVRVARR